MVSGSLSSNEESGRVQATLLNTYTETFENLFPYYLSIGMTEEQYWDKDCTLVKSYRKADEMAMERQNLQSWLQGRYFYDALCSVAPILHAFAKKGAKPQPYREEPYPITKQGAEQAREKKEKAHYNKGKVFMETFMAKNNKQFEEIKKGVR